MNLPSTARRLGCFSRSMFIPVMDGVGMAAKRKKKKFDDEQYDIPKYESHENLAGLSSFSV